MFKLLPYIPFLYVSFALYCIVSGGWKLVSPEKAARKRGKGKSEPTQKDVGKTRIAGAGYLVFGILFMLTFRLDVGWLDKPELLTWSANQNVQPEHTRIISDFLDNNVIPGMVVVVVDEDGSYIFSYGYQGVDKQKRITQDTIFEIGSISKVFTGLLLAEAVDSGAVTLETPIRSCVPEQFDTGQEFYDRITLGHLTTHTSGLPRLPKDLGFGINGYIAGLTGGNPYQKVTREKLFAYLSRTASPKQIGTESNYSNYGVGLLGTCLSSQKGLSYEETLQRIVTGPLEMTNTSIHLTPEQEALFTPGYRGYLRVGRFVLGMKNKPWLMGDGIAGAGGIRSSGADMLKFLEACIADELDFIPLAKRPIFQLDDESDMGMGWLLDRGLLENQMAIWHNGETGGFNSYIGFLADKPRGVFVIANTTVNIQSLGEEILSALGD